MSIAVQVCYNSFIMQMWGIKYTPGSRPGQAGGAKKGSTKSAKRPATSSDGPSDGPTKPKTPKFSEKWCQGRPWLEFIQDPDDQIDRVMKCLYCIEATQASNMSSWTSLRGQNAFINESSNLKVDNLQDHERSIGHRNAETIKLING